jgi:SAM-dependent methyltransferase
MTEAVAHWNRVYTTKGDRDVSWFEDAPAISMGMIEACGLTPTTAIVDIGGGNSRLVDALVAKGARDVSVLDVSGVALAGARSRLGDAAAHVNWIEADVTREWSLPPVDIWHDRAAFHFLTTEDERAAYVKHLHQKVKAGGHVIIATFALDGPERCSGLPVTRYSPATLAAEIGEGFDLVESRAHQHTTPWGAPQSFQYSRFRRAG